MLQRLIDDFKDSTGTALRLTSLAAAAAIALLITTCFLCAAAFVAVLDKYGPVAACLTGAAIFFVVTMIAAASYMLRKRAIAQRAKEHAEHAQIHREDHAGRSDGGGRGAADRPRDRRQAADSDPGGRRTGTGNSGEPRRVRRGRRSGAAE